MAQRSSDTFAQYKGVYGAIQPVVVAVEQLNRSIADIRNAEKEQDSITATVASTEKNDAEHSMVEKVLKVANVLYVIGFEEKITELTQLSAISQNSFFNVRDNDSISLANRIYDTAGIYADKLLPYGFTKDSIAELRKAIDDFTVLVSKPMDAIGSHKQKTKELKSLFAGLDSIFYDKLDKLMILFKDSNPAFYNEYRISRNLINTSVRHRKDNGEKEAGE
jgi:hypothetical protein